MKITISCSGKFHAFALAEQMEKHGVLEDFYTTYASSKNSLLKKFVKRIDKEIIHKEKIHTNSLLAFPVKLLPSKVYLWNNLFDQWVAGKLRSQEKSVFIGWSGMSLHSIRRAKALGMKTIVERGSSHIVYQNNILKEEYAKFGIAYSINQRVIDKELKEYEEADYISVPSTFVKKSFLENGITKKKIIQNAYGASSFFQKMNGPKRNKFVILYVGSLTVRKGLIYLFEALKLLDIPKENYEVYFIGKVADELKEMIQKYQQFNWIFCGHIDHYLLREYICNSDVAIQPSLEEGLSMVIPQIMSCGVPMIVTSNSGGADIISDNDNGFIVPIRSPEKIKEKIEFLYHHPAEQSRMGLRAEETSHEGYAWDDYGSRYMSFLEGAIL